MALVKGSLKEFKASKKRVLAAASEDFDEEGPSEATRVARGLSRVVEGSSKAIGNERLSDYIDSSDSRSYMSTSSRSKTDDA